VTEEKGQNVPKQTNTERQSKEHVQRTQKSKGGKGGDKLTKVT